MGVTAAVVAVAAIGTAVSSESSAQTRRIAGQRRNEQRAEVDQANAKRDENIKQEEAKSFSKIQRQRQRAMVANQAAPVGSSSSLLGGGGAAASVPGAAPAGTSNKTLLGQ